MTATTKRSTSPFNPFDATFEGEQWIDTALPRLVFRCPSRREPVAYLLTVNDDGNRASCTCDGYTYRATCIHTNHAATIARLALADLLATMPDADLAALDRTLTRRGYAPGSIRADVLGDELAKRARMQDRPLLNLRGRQARAELFG